MLKATTNAISNSSYARYSIALRGLKYLEEVGKVWDGLLSVGGHPKVRTKAYDKLLYDVIGKLYPNECLTYDEMLVHEDKKAVQAKKQKLQGICDTDVRFARVLECLGPGVFFDPQVNWAYIDRAAKSEWERFIQFFATETHHEHPFIQKWRTMNLFNDELPIGESRMTTRSVVKHALDE